MDIWSSILETKHWYFDCFKIGNFLEYSNLIYSKTVLMAPFCPSRCQKIPWENSSIFKNLFIEMKGVLNITLIIYYNRIWFPLAWDGDGVDVSCWTQSKVSLNVYDRRYHIKTDWRDQPEVPGQGFIIGSW